MKKSTKPSSPRLQRLKQAARGKARTFYGALELTHYMGILFCARREQLGLTFKELSGRCGLSPGQLDRIERGSNFYVDVPYILGRAMRFNVVALMRKAERMQDREFPHLRLERKRIQKKFKAIQMARQRQPA